MRQILLYILPISRKLVDFVKKKDEIFGTPTEDLWLFKNFRYASELTISIKKNTRRTRILYSNKKNFTSKFCGCG